MHNFGLAIDINVLYKGKWLKKSTSKSDWIESGIVDIAKRVGLKWGGDYINYHDPIHFEFKGLTIKELKVLKEQQQVEGNKVRF
jgi:hypothetical protein